MNAARVMTLTVLVGALLLFGMEPMVGRMLVPYFGSAVSTWLTALMFFQIVLFGGYLYAHLVAPRIGRWHLLLLFLPLLNLPLGVRGEVAPVAPMAQILLSLTLSVGLPFFVLSTTAVVLQLWWSRSDLGKDREPYPLYAASNSGSLLALLGYPFLVEPLAGLRAQSLVWAAGYVLYAGLVAASWHLARPEPGHAEEVVASGPPPSVGELSLWALLAALPSGFLLAVTSVIANEVGSFPMVWVLPLAIYLGTFVLLFRDDPVGMGLRRFWPELGALGLLGYSLASGTSYLLLAFQLTLFFLYCMVVHGELYTRRPEPAYLTRYYLALSFGGGLGGTVVNLVPPAAF
ncbi:MAG: ferrichrome ABC transporter permease, partial [Myxococcales bacterium]|nr:ferrichrome ABC transporter permease [Myxococcales bacterium]